jgi:hypothetical protein
VIARFVPAARIFAIRPSPYVQFQPRTILPNNTFGGGRVLMRPHDRGIDRHRPIDPAGSVDLGLDHSQQHVPGLTGPREPIRLVWESVIGGCRQQIMPLVPGSPRALSP